MPAVIRLMRAGAKKRPFYRMVVADSRRQRDGRFVEILGHYDPLTKPYDLVIQKDRVEEWIAKGARPSEQAASLLRSLGIKMVNASRSPKKAADGAAKTSAKKAAKKRAVKRTPSERKVKAKATRAKARAKKAAPATA